MSETTFGKTAKGQDEIKTRVAGLSQRQRQVLIFVDGKRTVDELQGMLKADDINEILASLADQGLVEKVASAPKAAAPNTIAPQPAAPASAPVAAAPAEVPQGAMSEKDIKAAEKRQKQLERERELAIERALSSRM
jgi:hypothetical protein